VEPNVHEPVRKHWATEGELASSREALFTDKEPIFDDLSVSKTHFTDKAGFLDHLSVKPGPKRLNFYGQTPNLHRLVRKQQ